MCRCPKIYPNEIRSDVTQDKKKIFGWGTVYDKCEASYLQHSAVGWLKGDPSPSSWHQTASPGLSAGVDVDSGEPNPPGVDLHLFFWVNSMQEVIFVSRFW